MGRVPETGVLDEPAATHLRTNMATRPLLHRSRTLILPIAATLCWSWGDGGTDVPEDTGQREAFIAAFLDLRMAALTSGSADLTDEVRDSVLAISNVTEQDLLDFIDTHGEDVEFMRDLWTELETLLTERLEQNARDEENAATEEALEPDVNQDGDGGV